MSTLNGLVVFGIGFLQGYLFLPVLLYPRLYGNASRWVVSVVRPHLRGFSVKYLKYPLRFVEVLTALIIWINAWIIVIAVTFAWLSKLTGGDQDSGRIIGRYWGVGLFIGMISLLFFTSVEERMRRHRSRSDE